MYMCDSFYMIVKPFWFLYFFSVLFSHIRFDMLGVNYYINRSNYLIFKQKAVLKRCLKT